MLAPVSGVRRGEDREGWAVLVLAGEVDLALSPALREGVNVLIGEGRARIVVDLEHVTFMDSTGLGVLVYAFRRTSALAGRLRLAHPGEQVCRLLELTGLDSALEVFADTAAACHEPVL
ncbi:STAS domain-containing protein [Streptomyces sp. NPDC040750]|uniref:STAS domain-containing protein n=1 Tax=unclassified Streptomyces TaxID=2593676 RepID=UPI0033C01C32